jgi:hypothetical protein
MRKSFLELSLQSFKDITGFDVLAMKASKRDNPTSGV